MPTSFPADGRAPWAEARVSYAGWIPNVLGHLSFSLVGLKGHWGNANALNHGLADDGTRSIAVRKDRIAQDYPYFDWMVRSFKPAAEQSYLMVARTHQAKIPFVRKNPEAQSDKVRVFEDEQGLLCGTVYITPKNRNPAAAEARKLALKKIDDLISGKTPPEPDICAQVGDLITGDGQEGFPSLAYRFALFRTGELRIWLEDEQFDNDWLADENYRTVLEDIFPKQVYYFLKDSLHTHYHHEPESDQLLPLTRLKQNPSACSDIESENEASWRRETLWGLARVVSSYRRSNRIRGLRRAQGVLAYADAFQATVAKTFRPADLRADPRFDEDLTTYDFAHTKQSVAALEGFRTWWKNGSIQILAGLTAILLAAFTIWSSALRFRIAQCTLNAETANQIACDTVTSQRSALVLNWIVEHPLVFSGILFATSALVYQTIVRDIDYGPVLGRFSRFLTAASRAIGTSIGRKLSNPYIGFVATLIFLIMIAVLLTGSFAYLGSIMQSR